MKTVSLKYWSRGEKTGAGLHDVKETKGISHEDRNCAKIYITETKIVSLCSLARVMKEKGSSAEFVGDIGGKKCSASCSEPVKG
jgi:hypothetical protein